MASVGIPDPFALQPAAAPPTSQESGSIMSWSEMHQAVRKTRKLGSTLLSRVPNTFTFRHVQCAQGSWTRLYFLGVLPGNRENSLLYTDIGRDTAWTPLIDSLPATSGHFSKEEQLLRERKRLGAFGITSYEFDANAGRFLFPACNSIFYCDDNTNADNMLCQSVAAKMNPNSCPGPRMDAKLCPSNAQLMAYVSSGDIWVTNLAENYDARLTHTHKGNGASLADDPRSAGVPSFVVQEEFDRYTGFWWQPLGKDKTVYRLLYEEVDESDVEVLHIVTSPDNVDSSFDEYRYPRAGSSNATCDLKLVEFAVDPDSGRIVSVVRKRLYDALECIFPWMEYLLRAGWTPDGKSIYCTLLDRQQKRLAIVLIGLDAFVDDTEEEDARITPRQYVNVIYEEISPVWIKVHDVLHFVPSDVDNELTLIWASEKCGFRHLYRISVELQQPMEIEVADGHIDQDDYVKASVLEEVQLTEGEWEVADHKIWVDEVKQLVYFIGYKDTPLETHLYAVSYAHPDTVIRLTELGYSHDVAMDKQCSMFVSVYSCISQPPASQVFTITMQNKTPSSKLTCQLLKPTVPSSEYHPPRLFSYVSSVSGHTMHGMYYRPHDLQPGKRYPTVMFVYGGPQVQLVTNAYKAIRFLRLHTLAALGYVVVTIDGRGSNNRGVAFESHIRHQLGQVEISDQVEGLEYIASKVDFIDTDRVAIHGWSYGGYLSLMGLLQRPDVFKVSIAGAPVTCWRLYDTGYTERYMDEPHRNQDGYKDGSILEHVDKFPDDENRLLIVHGMIDENVHFLHTSTLISSLVKACKPYQLQVYPNERHGIRSPESSEHYETMVLSFLQRNL